VHAQCMILTEHGIRFAKDGDHFYFVEYPNLAMLRVERYRVGGRTFGSLDDANAKRAAP